ncbi:mediator of RNA polymerase II transcription subunit 11 [Camarhynchus parvulus]|uniref:mediator of RNA polymerase II transcription subunit 11 n=1 Tax=Geospiza parvula TaxID=87175 RepID=UPI001237DB8B|nr:mediator of RNA polymerase II transcription subunit 11 [Camarhynchus parvulus]
MAGFGVANERLRALEELEREIGASLQSAGLVILELSKEKPQERHLDRQAAQFGAAVAKVEAELSAQIRYLTQVATGQPHEGSSYAARKSCQLALNRLDYARRRLAELARACSSCWSSDAPGHTWAHLGTHGDTVGCSWNGLGTEKWGKLGF